MHSKRSKCSVERNKSSIKLETNQDTFPFSKIDLLCSRQIPLEQNKPPNIETNLQINFTNL
jgi:hypothetical protein